MDGGRILRAAIWGKTKNFFYATQKASGIGRNIALFFIFLGVFSFFTRMPGGLWLMLIGWFLYSAAQTSSQQSTLQEILSGVKVRDVMAQDMVTVDHSISVQEAVDRYFLRFGYGGFPVLDGNKLLGMVTLKEAMDVPRGEWPSVRVSEIVPPHQSTWGVSPEDSVTKALEMMVTEDKGRLAVIERDKLVGLITRNGVARYVQIRKELS